MDVFGDLVGCATAIFTAWAAWSAWRASSVAKSAAEESSKISYQQTTALTVAAKANALASRINFYDRQIAEIESAKASSDTLLTSAMAVVKIWEWQNRNRPRLRPDSRNSSTRSHARIPRRTSKLPTTITRPKPE